MTSTFDPQNLRIFYDRLFPYEQMFEWLSYGESSVFFKREFSFTLADDVYIRYLTCSDAKDFRKQVSEKLPHKIDIGPVYPDAASSHHKMDPSKFKPVQRELVFDLDLTDYEPVQVGKEPTDELWDKGSWLFMAAAIKVVDRALREDFGYKHLLWVFSGRRGVHCWVCDKSARFLEDSERTAIVEYLTIIKGGEADGLDSVKITYPLHPALERAKKICEETAFNTTMLKDENQGLLRNEAAWSRLLNLMPSGESLIGQVRDSLAEEWKSNKSLTGPQRWQQLIKTVNKRVDTSKSASQDQKKQALKTIDQIVLMHTYPRLDEAVSIHRNHLLKSPFVIHPKTGKVCVPILDIENCHKFNPDGVPNLSTLIKELQASPSESSENRPPTSLDVYFEGFEKNLLEPLRKEREMAARDPVFKAEKKAKEDAVAAMTGDW